MQRGGVLHGLGLLSPGSTLVGVFRDVTLSRSKYVLETGVVGPTPHPVQCAVLLKGLFSPPRPSKCNGWPKKPRPPPLPARGNGGRESVKREPNRTMSMGGARGGSEVA